MKLYPSRGALTPEGQHSTKENALQTAKATHLRTISRIAFANADPPCRSRETI